MKMILNIAKAELQMLFYSPIAWILLIVFTVQSAMVFTGFLESNLLQIERGFGASNLSLGAFGGWGGLFSVLQGQLYFYIPLLTMGLVSRELSSGSIRLLYSSPVTNLHIIAGKYLSMMVYAAVMACILLVFVVSAQFSIKNFELQAVLTGVLGLYLLICAYAAIGLFMSSLTSYQIVAAIGTLAVFMALSMINRYGQNITFLRDVTWWLSIGGRSDEFIKGLICSEDVLYFVTLIALFISLTVIRLNAVRQRTRFVVTLGKNLTVIVLACLIGYISSRPRLMSYYDATHTKRNTLTESSQDIIARMEGGVTITTYINLLGDNGGYAHPAFLNPDKERFQQYLRFKPEIKLKYVHYFDSVKNPYLDQRYPDLNLRERMGKMADSYKVDSARIKSPEEMGAILADLREEGNSFVRQIVRESGEKHWLRIFNDSRKWPSEAEITAAFKRTVMRLPVVGFYQGHNSRSYSDYKDRSYGTFANTKGYRYALMNQGFNVAEVRLDKAVPPTINILVISDLYSYFTPDEEAYLQQYIERGGNLFVLGEPRRREVMQPLFRQFGFEMVPGVLVQSDTMHLPDLLPSYPTREAGTIAYHFEMMRNQGNVLGTPSVGGLEQIADLGYSVTPLFRTDTTGVWNETENRYFTDMDTIVYNPAAGEVMKSYHTVVALSRAVHGKEQKIVLAGDADCISNTMGDNRIRRTSNYSLITGAFFWLSDHEVPIDVRRPPLTDNELLVRKPGVKALKATLLYGFPILLFILAVLIWVRRRGQ